MTSFRGGYQKSQYRGRAIRQRFDFRPFLFTGLKLAFGFAGIVLLSTVYMLVYGLVTQCDYFKARNIEITGTDKLCEEDILEQATLYPGINILSVNLVNKRKMLLAHPEIEDADIMRTYPDGLRIRVKEHRPMAVIDLGRRFLMNESGKIYREWRTTDVYDLPLVKGLKFSDLTGTAGTGKTSYGAVMRVLQIGKDPDCVLPNTLIKKIHVDSDMGVTLYAGVRIREIKLGFGGFSDKYNRLKKVTMYLKARHQTMDFSSIDLMNTDRIVVHPMKVTPNDKQKKEV